MLNNWVDEAYCNLDIYKIFLESRSEAKEQAKGLWRNKEAMPPWEWRRQ